MITHMFHILKKIECLKDYQIDGNGLLQKTLTSFLYDVWYVIEIKLLLFRVFSQPFKQLNVLYLTSSFYPCLIYLSFKGCYSQRYILIRKVGVTNFADSKLV